MASTSIIVETQIEKHLKEFPNDRNYIDLLLKNEEFSPDEKGYLSWFNFNLNGINRGKNLIQRIEEITGSITGWRVLDVGAGGGGISIAFCQHGCHVSAIEIDEVRITWLKTRISDLDLPIPIISQPIENIQLEKFDLIICNAVIEHVNNWQSFVSRLLELTDRYLYLSWPNKLSIPLIYSDPHYGLFGAVFLTGKLMWLQDRYLKLMKIKRNAWVIDIPLLKSVKKFITHKKPFAKVKFILPQSLEKIRQPQNINYKPARIFLSWAKKIGVSENKLSQIILSQRPDHEILVALDTR